MTKDNRPNSEMAHLVTMANDIAANLDFLDDAADKIADHINRFWAPRMRGLLVDYARNGGQGISEALQPALKKLRTG